jgi:hypothetical protein
LLEVLPKVPYRQWTRSAARTAKRAALERCVTLAIFRWQRARAKQLFSLASPGFQIVKVDPRVLRARHGRGFGNRRFGVDGSSNLLKARHDDGGSRSRRQPASEGGRRFIIER